MSRQSGALCWRQDDLRRGSSVKRVIVSMMTAMTGSSF